MDNYKQCNTVVTICPGCEPNWVDMPKESYPILIKPCCHKGKVLVGTPDLVRMDFHIPLVIEPRAESFIRFLSPHFKKYYEIYPKPKCNNFVC